MKNKSFFLISAITAIRTEFRKWYGVISVNELVSNRALAREIEVLEHMLAIHGG
jgi:hypothetical protein